MECFLSPRRTRRFLQCLSFGAIAVWIILGAYMREEPQASHSAAGKNTRHLLSFSEPEVLEAGLLAGKSPLQCAALNMTYIINNVTVMVNLTDDQVSSPADSNLQASCCL